MIKPSNWRFWTVLCVVAGLAGCEGPMGPAGADGMDGDPGGPGMAGGPGADGMDGMDGMDGIAGTDGAPGVAGTDGTDGADGLPGIDGVNPPIDLLNAGIGGWRPENRAALNALIMSRGRNSPTFDAMNPPVAVFDWDNTVVKNDIGDATFFWMINNDKILQPPGRDWSVTNSALTAAALTALNTACDALAAPGAPLPTSFGAGLACADALYHIYNNGRVPPGVSPAASAWTSPVITYTTNQQYAWVVQLQAGYRPHEIREFARAAYDENNAANPGDFQTVGTVTTATGFVRVYEQIADLIDALDYAGFDVWVVSASGQYVVEEVAEEVGVPRDHVIGVRSVVARGRLTYDFQGCGTVADGADTLITFDEGKRCWINEVIFHIPSATAMARAPVAQRPVFVAGDSDTDIAMLKDATTLKLIINRGKIQTMCNALAGARTRWLIQPMFILPRACPTAPFACDTALDAMGIRIVDEAEPGVGFPAPPPPYTDTFCTLPVP